MEPRPILHPPNCTSTFPGCVSASRVRFYFSTFKCSTVRNLGNSGAFLSDTPSYRKRSMVQPKNNLTLSQFSRYFRRHEMNRFQSNANSTQQFHRSRILLCSIRRTRAAQVTNLIGTYFRQRNVTKLGYKRVPGFDRGPARLPIQNHKCKPNIGASLRSIKTGFTFEAVTVD